jgi:Ca2+-transporting ATPase
MFWVFGGTFFFLALAVYLPPLQSIFHFTFMHPLDILLSLAVGMASTLWFELIKVVLRLRKIDLLH